MKKPFYGMFLLVLMVAVALAGCETVKGMKKDVENTFNNSKKVPAAVNQLDAKMQEKLW